MARVKICGITNRGDLQVAVDAGADAVGFITDVPVDTPREIDPGTAADLVAETSPFVTTTLVLMPDSPGRAVDLARTIEPDVLQLHCEFDPEQLQFIRAESASKVVVVVDAEDEARAHELDGVVDALLVDSTTDDGAGGTGKTHDWERTRDLAAAVETPVILAGGLTPENVAEAIAVVDPYAVDVASGVEADGGMKDHDAVRQFVAESRRATEEEVAA